MPTEKESNTLTKKGRNTPNKIENYAHWKRNTATEKRKKGTH